MSEKKQPKQTKKTSVLSKKPMLTKKSSLKNDNTSLNAQPKKSINFNISKEKKLKKKDKIKTKPTLNKEVSEVDEVKEVKHEKKAIKKFPSFKNKIPLKKDDSFSIDSDSDSYIEDPILYQRSEKSLDMTKFETFMHDNLDFDFDAVEEEEVFDDPILQQITELPFSNFLDTFMDEIPQVEGLTVTDSSEDREPTYTVHKSITKHTDAGHFVNPLTGGSISSADIVEEYEEEKEEEETAEEDMWQLEIPKDDENIFAEKIVDESETLHNILLDIFSKRKVHTISDDDFDEKLRLSKRALQALRSEIANFIKSFIDYIVDVAEYVDPITLINLNMDKTRVMMILMSIKHQFDKEQRVNVFLKRKTISYYRRKQNYRAIIEDHPAMADKEKLLYEEAINELDKKLQQQTQHEDYVTTFKHKLYAEQMHLQEQREIEKQSFHQRVYQAFSNGKSDKFQNHVQQQLDKMNRTHNEITKVRTLMIMRQHNIAAINQESEKIEFIGDNQRLSQYVTLSDDVKTLTKKLELRQHELKKTHERLNCELHIKAHVNEKRMGVMKSLKKAFQILSFLYKMKGALRMELYNLHLEMEKYRNEINEIQGKSGLLNHPTLLYDYDDTIEKLNKAQREVRILNFKTNRLNAQIKKIKKQTDQF